MRLADALAALDARSFERLCRRRGIDVDAKKRLAPAEQAARQLAEHVRTIPLTSLPEPSQKVAWLLATSPEGAPRLELGGGVLPLIEHHLVFPVPGAPERVAMPVEYRVQLPPGPGEDRTSARALLAIQDDEALSVLGTQLLGRRPIGPAPLWMGTLLERLETPSGIDALVSTLAPKQRRLLEAIEARGGQLETDELLELERSPIRVTLAGGAALPTRSASYHLFARGLLLPRTRGLWVVPAEVGAHVGAVRRAVERAERKRLLARVAEDEDLSPPRARLGEDPAPASLALLAALRKRDALPADARGVRRSDVKSAASSLGIDPETAELLVAVARAAGARFEGAPVGDAGSVLFATWRGTDVWDEAREEPDVHRAGDQVSALPTPTRAMREIVLDLLEAMPRERFAPADEVARASVKDLRASGAERLLERARKRAEGRIVGDVPEVARRILLESLPRLGAADRAKVDGKDVVRLTARARSWLDGGAARASELEPSRWEGGGRARIGAATRVRVVLAAAEGGELIASSGALWLRVDASTVAHALERGLDAGELRARFEALASPLDASVERALAGGVEAARPRLSIVPASAFVPVPDEPLRERLLSHAPLRALLVEPSPAGGLLVRAGVSRSELTHALEEAGVALDEPVS